jgi:L-serine kinase (ADP)
VIAMDCELVDVSRLKRHEETDEKNLRRVMDSLRRTGVVRNPLVADRESLVILDGHHRLEAARRLHLRRMPVQLVEYLGSDIRVVPRRDTAVSKEQVVERGLKNDPFPPKTTRHVIPGRVKGVRIPLKMLA